MSNEEYNGVADFGGDFDAVVGYPYAQAVPIRYGMADDCTLFSCQLNQSHAHIRNAE